MQGASVSSPQVIQSLQGVPFAQVSAGGAHSFGLTLSGAVFGWGRNKFGQLGLSDNDGKANTLDIHLSFLFYNHFYCVVFLRSLFPCLAEDSQVPAGHLHMLWRGPHGCTNEGMIAIRLSKKL